MLIITLEEERQHGFSHGAFSYLLKEPTTANLEVVMDRLKAFATPHTRRLLVAEDNDIERNAVIELLDYDDIYIVEADSGSAALAEVRKQPVDCVVLDLRLPNMSGFELLEQFKVEPNMKSVLVVVFTSKDLSEEEQTRLGTMAKSFVSKDVRSPERLLDETALFLHRVIIGLPPQKQAMLERLLNSSEVLRHRKVLVVEDDARNIFALAVSGWVNPTTSYVLKQPASTGTSSIRSISMKYWWRLKNVLTEVLTLRGRCINFGCTNSRCELIAIHTRHADVDEGKRRKGGARRHVSRPPIRRTPLAYALHNDALAVLKGGALRQRMADLP